MARATVSPTLGWLAALLAVGVLVAGCPRRQQIAQQTMSAMVNDVQGEAQSSVVPEGLLTWTEVARLDTGFDEARGIACTADGNVLVAGDQAIRALAPDGMVLWEIAVNGNAGPLAIAPDGLILVGLHDRVIAIGPEASVRQTWEPFGERTWVTSIVPTASEVLIADAGNRTVWRFANDGTFLSEIARRDDARGIPALSVPSPHLDIAMAMDGTLLVVNPGLRSIQYHSLPDGALLRSWGRSSNAIEGFGGCCNPTDIALLPDGRVVTSEKGIPRVKVYSPEGELLAVVAPPTAFDPQTVGIDLAIDVDGRVAVLDPFEGTVRLYEETTASPPGEAGADVTAGADAPAGPEEEPM